MAVRRLSAEPARTSAGGRLLSALFIGDSAGGPQGVERILRFLRADFPAPVAVCQHMPSGFTKTWAQRLDDMSELEVREARQGEPFVSGRVFIAPIGKHMRVVADSKGEPSVRLDSDFSGSVHVPSIDILMSSAAQTFGNGVLAVLPSGFGSDGANGMLAVRRAGGHTICEARDTAVAFSMPGAAVELGAAAEEVSGDQLPRVIVERVGGRF